MLNTNFHNSIDTSLSTSHYHDWVIYVPKYLRIPFQQGTIYQTKAITVKQSQLSACEEWSKYKHSLPSDYTLISYEIKSLSFFQARSSTIISDCIFEVLCRKLLFREILVNIFSALCIFHNMKSILNVHESIVRNSMKTAVIICLITVLPSQCQY